MRRHRSGLVAGLAIIVAALPAVHAQSAASPTGSGLDLSLPSLDVAPSTQAPALSTQPPEPRRPPFKPAEPEIKVQPYIYDTRDELSATGRARAERLTPPLGEGKVERRLQETGFGVRLIRPF